MKELFVCEKPDQAETYAKSLCEKVSKKRGYLVGDDGKVFTYALGHLITLKSPDEIDPKFGWKGGVENLPFFMKNIPLKIIEEKRDQYKVVIDLMKEAEMVYIATDAGREGEHIFRKIYSMSKLEKPLKRLWCRDNTVKGIRKAYDEAKDGRDYIGIAAAGKLREEADLLIGINSTQLLTKLSGSNKVLSLGRVQTPTLAMIVGRDNLIENFKKAEFYTIVAQALDNQQFEIQLNKDERLSKNDANIILSSLSQRSELSIDVKNIIEKPKKLFDLTDLQMFMSKKYNWSAKKTLDTTQSLYQKKLVTYPRTSSQYLASDEEIPLLLRNREQDSRVKEILERKYSIESNFINPSKVTDHEAIIITEEIPTSISSEEKKLYDEILTRFLAAFYPVATYKKVSVTFTDGEYEFKAIEKTLIDPGWKHLYGIQSGQSKLENVEGNDIGEYSIKKKETSPPKRYNVESLLGDMKNAGKFIIEENEKKILKNVEGIGTPATRSDIIELLLKREFITEKGSHLISTKLGREIIGMMPGNFSLYSPKLTALFESMLLDVQEKKLNEDTFYKNLEILINKVAKEIRTNVRKVENTNKDRNIIGTCTQCGSEIIETKLAYSCSGYKNGCKVGVWKNGLERLGKKKISSIEAGKLLAGEIVTVKLKSKSGNPYKKQVHFNLDKNWIEFAN